MKLKKIISVISAFAMAASMFTVASAASLGGKPTVNAEFVEYTTNTNKTWAKAWIKVTIDMSAAQELAAYKSDIVYDEDEEDDVAVESGNGISTMGGIFALSNTTDFSTQSTNNTKPDALNLKINTENYTLSFGPKDNPADYYINGTSEILLNFKTTNFDASADFKISEMTIDGKYVDVYNAVSSSEVWSYSQLADTIAVTGCTIPSYNEWSTPAVSDPVLSMDEEVTEVKVDNTDGKGYIWSVNLAKGAKDITAFTAKFTSGTDSTDKEVRNLDALNATDGLGTTKAAFYIGLKTAKIVDSAVFTVTDADSSVSATWNK